MRKRIYSAWLLLATFLVCSCGDQNGPETPPEPEVIDPTIYVGIGRSGISSGSGTYNYFKKCIEDAGGQMVWFESYATSESKATADLKRVDALIIPGSSGADTSGRSACDKRLIGAAVAQGKPVLGICWGCQRINLMRGGELGAVIEDFPDSPYDHKAGGSVYPNHDITIDESSTLYQILKVKTIGVNSSHKHYCKVIPAGVKVVATAPDGVTEAVEGVYPGDMLLGVQFHPEYLYALLGKEEFLPIFEHLVNQAREVKFADKK